jgi:hypothetical protein
MDTSRSAQWIAHEAAKMTSPSPMSAAATQISSNMGPERPEDILRVRTRPYTGAASATLERQVSMFAGGPVLPLGSEER